MELALCKCISSLRCPVPLTHAADIFTVCRQSLILINDPFYNEPSNESTRGLSETNLASNKYNADLHLNTIRSGAYCPTQAGEAASYRQGTTCLCTYSASDRLATTCI